MENTTIRRDKIKIKIKEVLEIVQKCKNNKKFTNVLHEAMDFILVDKVPDQLMDAYLDNMKGAKRTKTMKMYNLRSQHQGKTSNLVHPPFNFTHNSFIHMLNLYKPLSI